MNVWLRLVVSWAYLVVSGACLVQDIPGQTREDQSRGPNSRTCVLVIIEMIGLVNISQKLPKN